MKAIVHSPTEPRSPGLEAGAEPAGVCATSGIQEPLLAEIRQLGGEMRMKGAQGALDAFESALAGLVRDNPERYGAREDAVSQARVVSQLIDSVRGSFLSRTVEELRRHTGYIKVWGFWIHRAVFTFLGFGLLAAATLPLCAVSLMSASAWGWLPGAFGLVVAFCIGAWILSRIRNQ